MDIELTMNQARLLKEVLDNAVYTAKEDAAQYPDKKYLVEAALEIHDLRDQIADQIK